MRGRKSYSLKKNFSPFITGMSMKEDTLYNIIKDNSKIDWFVQ